METLLKTLRSLVAESIWSTWAFLQIRYFHTCFLEEKESLNNMFHLNFKSLQHVIFKTIYWNSSSYSLISNIIKNYKRAIEIHGIFYPITNWKA